MVKKVKVDNDGLLIMIVIVVMVRGQVLGQGHVLWQPSIYHDGHEDNVDNDVYGGDETVCFII